MSYSHEHGYGLVANSSSRICLDSSGILLWGPLRLADAGFQLADEGRRVGSGTRGETGCVTLVRVLACTSGVLNELSVDDMGGIRIAALVWVKGRVESWLWGGPVGMEQSKTSDDDKGAGGSPRR
jgi:hypothetical protein